MMNVDSLLGKILADNMELAKRMQQHASEQTSRISENNDLAHTYKRSMREISGGDSTSDCKLASRT